MEKSSEKPVYDKHTNRKLQLWAEFPRFPLSRKSPNPPPPDALMLLRANRTGVRSGQPSLSLCRPRTVAYVRERYPGIGLHDPINRRSFSTPGGAVQPNEGSCSSVPAARGWTQKGNLSANIQLSRKGFSALGNPFPP